MSRKQETKGEVDKLIYTDPKTGKKELIRADIITKLNRIKDQLISDRVMADVWYDLDKHSFEWEESDGQHFRSYNGENLMQVKDIPISVIPHDNPVLKVELSDEYQHNHLQEAMDYALKEKEDIIGKPNHYCAGRKFEPKDVIRDWDLNFNLGNTVKYISRNGRKAGNSALQDLKKARQYLDFEIAYLESKEK